MNDKQKFVLGFIFDKKLEKVLLIKKIFKRDINPDLAEKLAGKLNAPGGKLEKDENIYQGISREIKEEAGLNIRPLDWANFCNLDAKFGYVYCFYTVTDDIFNYVQKEEESLDIYSINELVNTYEGYTTSQRFYQDYFHMENLQYLIPMALNHCNKTDSCQLFEIKETYER